MKRIAYRARWAVAAGVFALPLFAAGCDPKKELLSPQQPGVISPGDIQSGTGADALYVGAVGYLNTALNGSGNSNNESLWNWTGLFTDEFKSGDTFSQRNDDDRRALQDNDGVLTPIYRRVQQGRGHARTAINALLEFEPDQKSKIGEMYFVMGFLELSLGEYFCNGIPLGETVDGVPQYTAPLTDQVVIQTAIARFDTALTYVGSASDAQSKQVRNAVLVAKGRAQVDLGKFADAAATVAGVPTGFQYSFTYSPSTVDNEWWILGPSVQRYSVGDSVDISGPVLNAIPFASLNDPRVPIFTTGRPGEDNQTIFVWTHVLEGRDDPTPVVSGIDARLIEAEAKLQAADYAGMMKILNDLRTNAQTIGTFEVPTMPALGTVPATKDDAINLFFREKALWQFGRGYRMDDLRRLVRQYQRAQDKVFPSGVFFKTGNYGDEVAFPVVDDEKTNPNFKGCIDRNA
jgi:hypothetical protein